MSVFLLRWRRAERLMTLPAAAADSPVASADGCDGADDSGGDSDSADGLDGGSGDLSAAATDAGSSSSRRSSADDSASRAGDDRLVMAAAAAASGATATSATRSAWLSTPLAASYRTLISARFTAESPFTGTPFQAAISLA